jgi:signal transduction histidine kinase
MRGPRLAAMDLGGRVGRRLRHADPLSDRGITPPVDTSAVTRQDSLILHRLNQVLERRATILTTANRRLLRDVNRCKETERTLKASRGHYLKLWRESRHLQQDLRRLTHQILATQEGQRRDLSRNLQDDIAQTLLGINVRLLALRLTDRKNTRRLRAGITGTQHLVAASAKSMQRSSRVLKSA